MIEIINLHVSVKEIPILKGLTLSIKKGEIHAIMGPNGAGKSTLARVLAGHPAYEVTKGQVLFKTEDLLAMSPEERFASGLFMSFQYPPEINGVSNQQFLQSALSAKRKSEQKEPLSDAEFQTLLMTKMALMEIRPEFKERSVNEGFSGGEKKRNEILQMLLFNPDLTILDETDSGLDIDAMKIVANGVQKTRHADNALLIITHYKRLLEFIEPDFVHVLADGMIVKSGGASLALELEEQGYSLCKN